jgi:hypothetical protein
MSTISRLTKLACTGAAVAMIAACSSGPADESASSAAETTPATHHAHIMPMRNASRSAKVEAAPAGSHLKYYGGPVLDHVKVVNVFWNSQVRYQTEMNAFYPAVLNSNYMDWLSEYNTPTQQIGRGTFVGSYVDTGAPTGSTITNDQIQAELERLLDNNLVPANDGQNMIYMFYFPSGVKIQLDANTSSCVQFCAYHNTATHAGKNLYYGVMPDVNAGACSFGCGTAGGAGNLTAVSSHELIEAVTDGAVGLVQGDQPVAPLAWYDQTNGEIGDICVGQTGTVAGQTVQLEWSNFENACIAARRSCQAGCGSRVCGQDACGNSCGFCGAGQACNSQTGQCGACTPNCNGRQCGDDGCGGSCGTCSGSSQCDANGQCGACTPTCNGQQCGNADGCGGTCGCPAGHTCIPQIGICF